MTVEGLLDELRRRDIRVWADGERLRCDAPAGALTDELAEELRRNKPGLLDFLRSVTRQAGELRAIVPLQPHGRREPVFAVGGHNGDVYCYRLLAAQLGPDQPFYGLQPPGSDVHSEPLTSVEHLAAYFAGQLLSFRPKDPCVIAGYCAGGTIAFELARQLQEQGVPIRFVALFAAPHPERYRPLVFLRERVQNGYARITRHVRALTSGTLAERRDHLLSGLRRMAARQANEQAAATDPVLLRRARVERATVSAAGRYRAGFFHGRLCLFLPAADAANMIDMPQLWRGAAERVEEYSAPSGCNTDNMLREPHVRTIAELFKRC